MHSSIFEVTEKIKKTSGFYDDITRINRMEYLITSESEDKADIKCEVWIKKGELT